MEVSEKQSPELLIKTRASESRFSEFLDRARKVFLPDTAITGMVYTAECLRSMTMYPSHPGAASPAAVEQMTQTIPSQFPEILYRVGDLADGWAWSFLGYYGVTLLTRPWRDKIPDNVKVAVGVLLGTGIVLKHELSGVFSGSLSVKDVRDIPAGIIGALGFAGIHWLLKRFNRDSSKQIKKLESELGIGETDLPAVLETIAITEGENAKQSLPPSG